MSYAEKQRGVDHPRWHHQLHPSVEGKEAQNAFPGNKQGFMHPTHIALHHHGEQLAWTSRDHRKNRHMSTAPKGGNDRGGETVLGRIGHMRRLEYWNISWWVAILFTLGSIVWVVNGFAAFLPLCNSNYPEMDTANGWTAWLGATIFTFGGFLGLLEAWNRSNEVNFGWAVDRSLHSSHAKADGTGFRDPEAQSSTDELKPVKKWIWYSTDGNFFHEIGFLAAFVQVWAATIFWIAGWTSIPTIQTAIEDNPPLLNGVFWSPQVIGGSGFIISSLLIMLETQKKWYRPSLLSLGWHVGFWNLIGAIGFTLCGALGYAANASSGAAYQSSLSTFWGGWAFLIGSVIQWYESVNSI